MISNRTVNPRVPGSSPGTGAIRTLCKKRVLYYKDFSKTLLTLLIKSPGFSIFILLTSKD